MTANPRRRPVRNLQRRIRRWQVMSGESYMVAAAAVEAEWERGHRYLSDPSVPADVAAEVRKAGLIPLEPLTLSAGWDWWCRCRWCSAVVDVRPAGHGYQSPGRSRYFLDEDEHANGRCTRPAPEPPMALGSAALTMTEPLNMLSLPAVRALVVALKRHAAAAEKSVDPDPGQAG